MKPSILHKAVRLISYLIPVSIVLLLIAVTVFFYTQSYDSFIRVIIDSLSRQDMETVLRERFFPPEKFNRIKGLLIISSIMSIASLILLYRYQNAYNRSTERVRVSCSFYLCQLRNIYNTFSKTGKSALIFLLLIVLCRSLWYARTFDIQYDEAWNYNLFLDKHLMYSIGAYNNYPLHNIVSWFFVHLLGSSVLLLRLPSILIGLACTFFVSMVTQYFFKKEKVSMLVAALFCCLPVNLFYMMYARGVIFDIFFALLVCSLMLYYVKTGFTWRRIFFLSLLNALGTFSMLSHPFFILGTGLALFCYAALHEKKYILMAMAYGFFSLCLSLIVLLPMMLGTGLSPVVSALSAHQQINLSAVIRYMGDVSFFITGFTYLFYFLFVLSIGLAIYSFKRNNILFLVILMNTLLLLLPVVLPFIIQMFPPERALSFLVLVPVNMAVLLFYFFVKWKTGEYMLYPVALLCIAVFSYKAHTHPFLNWSKELDKQVHHVALLLKKEDIHQVYNDSRDFDYFVPGIDYYFKQGKERIEFHSSSRQSTRYTTSVGDLIDGVVYSKKTQSVFYITDSLMYELDDVLIYKRRK